MLLLEHHYAYILTDKFKISNQLLMKMKIETNEKRLLTEVADSLFHYGVTMLPTRVVYEANRDIIRAQSLEHITPMNALRNGPDPNYHGAYHYDWTSDDEYYWSKAFDLWGDLIFEFNKRGGRVAYGTDDSYIFASFSNIRELQLLRETGMHTLEVLKSATLNSAKTLRQEKLGLVRPGYIADLIIINESPLYNLRNMLYFTQQKEKTPIQTKQKKNKEPDSVNNGFLSRQV